MRLAVYTDYEYTSDGTRRYGQRAFVVFLEALGEHVERLVLVGRFDPKPATSHYPLSEQTELVGLPHYESLGHPLAVLRSLVVSVARFWRLLDEVDVVWVLGPYPHSVLLAVLTALRGRRLVLGVRQDFPLYVRSRRPGRRWMHLSADLLEWIWRLLARRYPVVVVGPELERKYLAGGARSVFATTVSLVSEADLEAAAEAVPARDYSGALTVLTVGRLDVEKNPLLLADVLARLSEDAREWRLLVCGEGPLRDQLAARIEQLGLRGRVELLGYVPIDGGLLASCTARATRSCTSPGPRAFRRCSSRRSPRDCPRWRRPSAACPPRADGAALLVEPNDAAAAAAALPRIVEDPALREKLIDAGLERARAGTLESATARLAEYLATTPPAQEPAARTRRSA